MGRSSRRRRSRYDDFEVITRLKSKTIVKPFNYLKVFMFTLIR